MSDVRVTIGANSAQLESEFENVKNSARGLKKSVGDVGGVLEGDRRVENKMTAFVEGFKSAQNGADLLANTMGNLGDVFKSSLAVGVGLNVGAALVGMIGSAIAAADELKKSAAAVGEELRAAFESGDSGRLESSIKKANDEIEKLRKSYNSFFGRGAARTGIAEISEEKTRAGKELVEIARIELEIQKLITAEQWEKADAMQEELRYKKEAALIKDLKLDDNEYVARIEILMEASDARLQAKRDERRKAQAQKDEQAAKETADAEKKQIDAEQEAVEQFNQWKADQEATALKQKQDDEAKALKLGMEAFGRHEAEKTRIAEEAEKKRLKVIEDADKLALEGKKEVLKNERDIVKEGWQEQKQRDDRALKGLLGGETMQAQRVNDRAVEMAREKAAGIAARDEVRRDAKGDALKMRPQDIAAVKERILGEKQWDKKRIEAAIANIPKIEAEIAKLVAKLGVK